MSAEQLPKEEPLTMHANGTTYVRVDLYTQAVQERDLYKFQAELNAETIKEMQHQRDVTHDELVHLQNAPGRF